MSAVSATEDSVKPLPMSTSVITLPIPSPNAPTYLAAHITHFQDRSLLVWCGEASPGSAARIEHAGGASAPEAPPSSLLIEEHHPSTSQQTPSTSPNGPPTGVLGQEWAVAMSAPNGSNALATSLFRSNLDLSKPMSARLAKRYQLSQLFLSLNLPDQIIELLQGPFSDPLGGKAVLMLEGALGKAIKQSVERHVGTGE